MAIFRVLFLKSLNIPVIAGTMFNDMHKSYTGGSTEMFIPIPHRNENVYAYDVNSLYPHVMTYPMPVAFNRLTHENKKEYFIKYFEGDISKTDKSPYGFFEVEVTCPKDIKHPLLQLHFDTGKGIRTITPTGT